MLCAVKLSTIVKNGTLLRCKCINIRFHVISTETNFNYIESSFNLRYSYPVFQNRSMQYKVQNNSSTCPIFYSTYKPPYFIDNFSWQNKVKERHVWTLFIIHKLLATLLACSNTVILMYVCSWKRRRTVSIPFSERTTVPSCLGYGV